MSIDVLAPATVPVLDSDPFSDEFLNDPYEEHRRMRAAGPVFRLERYGIWGAARYDEVVQILKDPQTFCSARGVGIADFHKDTPFRQPSLLLEADPPEHTQARAVVAKVLTPVVVRQLKELFMERAHAHVEALVKRGSFDAVKDLSEAFPLEVFPDFMGMSKDGRENLLPYGNMVFNTFGPENDLVKQAKAKSLHVVDWIMEQCRPGVVTTGLAPKIHAAAAEAGYSLEDQARLMRSFLSAGVDTTVHGIGNAIWCLARFPEQFDKLRADLSLVRPAFEEVLRYESSVQTFFRTTTRDVEIGGVTIPEGEKVLMFLAAANRDERQWGPDAEDFDIARKPIGHVAFGFGIHACLGQMLARLEGECVLTALATHVKRIEITGPVTRQLNNTLRGLEHLPVTVTAA